MMDTEGTEANIARENYDEACNRFQEAEQEFECRQLVYEQDVMEFGDTASRTELDLFHVERGRKLVRILEEAEQAWEQARARAKALGVLLNHAGQESDFVDDEDDGYRLSQDPDGKVSRLDHGTIEAWVEGVVEKESGDGGDESMPDVEQCGANPIGLSDSLSVVAEGRRRLRIDRWRSICEAIERDD